MKNYRLVLFFTLAFAFTSPVFSARAVSGEDGECLENGLTKDGKVCPVDGGGRRSLQGCSTANPIDECWRCKADWADNRQAMAKCAKGFAEGTTGGEGGEIYEVTDNSDDPEDPKEGSLRWGVTRTKPIWVTFKESMVITLKQELVITSDTTIDGRGATVEITNGGGLTCQGVKNVIISNLHIHDIHPTTGGNIMSAEGKVGPRSASDGDGICVFESTQIWIDHCTLHGGKDGLIDVTFGSSFVTISNCAFSKHCKVILLGADDSHAHDENMLTTVAYNKFSDGCVQRMPRCRFGFFHVVNNYYDKWGSYAIGGSSAPTIISEGNHYYAPDDSNAKVVDRKAGGTEEEYKTWNWRSKDDLLLNGAIFEPSGSDVSYTPEQQKGMIPGVPADTVEKMAATAGILQCTPGSPC